MVDKVSDLRDEKKINVNVIMDGVGLIIPNEFVPFGYIGVIGQGV